MQRLVARLAPRLSKHALKRCCFVRTTAEHITAFSLGVLNELSRPASGGRSPRRVGARR